MASFKHKILPGEIWSITLWSTTTQVRFCISMCSGLWIISNSNTYICRWFYSIYSLKEQKEKIPFEMRAWLGILYQVQESYILMEPEISRLILITWNTSFFTNFVFHYKSQILGVIGHNSWIPQSRCATFQ